MYKLKQERGMPTIGVNLALWHSGGTTNTDGSLIPAVKLVKCRFKTSDAETNQ